MNKWLMSKFASVLLMIAACDGGDSDEGGEEGGPEEHVTFASLPQADRDGFEAWKRRVIKDCAWEQAFPSLADQFPSPTGDPYLADTWVDLGALLAGNAGSPLVAGPDGQLVLLGPAVGDIGFHTNTRSQRATIDGRVRVFEISANWEDGICVVTLAGEELYRTMLPAAVPVIASFDREALAAAGSDLQPLREAEPTGAAAVAMMAGGPLTEHALSALRPNARAHAVLAARFDSSEAVARKTFPLRSPAQPHAVRVLSATVTPFLPRGTLYGPRDSLRSIYAGGTVQLELLYRDLHAKLVAIRAEIAVAVGGLDVKATAISAGPLVALEDRATIECFVARGAAVHFETAQPRSPAFDEQFAACRFLASDGFAALAGDPNIRHQIAVTAMVPGRSLAGTYRGWDEALISVAHRLDDQGQSLTVLDPASEIPALSVVLDFEAMLRGAIAEPATRTAFGRPLIALVFRWFFRGTAPSATTFADIRSALANTATPYSASAQGMVLDLELSTSNESARGMQAMRCALGLVGARRNDVDHMLAAADALPFADAFASTQRQFILQDCPSAAQLVELEAAIAATGAFVAADQARGGNSARFKAAIEPLVRHALDQRWTEATFAAVSDMLGFAVVSDFVLCASNPSRAEQIACSDSSLTLFSTDKLLAPAVIARNATLARELTARWPALADARFAGARFEIGAAFFDGLWQGCADDGFARLKAQLFGLLDALIAATTFEQRFDIGLQISALVGSSTCQ